MNKFRLFAAALMLTAFFSISSFAQTTQNQTANKIVIVDTSAFFKDKIGITKILNASKQLDVEIAPKRNELQQMASRIQTLQKEIETLQKNIQNKIPVDEKAAQAKVDELDRLKREGKFKEEEYNKFLEKRQNELLGPPFSEALKALEEYIRTKGFALVFDVSKDQGGMLIFATDQYDITKDFIATYNARPATSTTTPKPPTKP
jgi:Skp family chaperone for outer membrane proteins